MSSPEQCEWLTNVWFDVYRYAASKRWPVGGGLYVFAQLDQAGKAWIPLYVGRAKSLHTRLSNHEDWPEAEQEGATHVHVVVVPNPATRRRLERDLYDEYEPLLNDHRPH